MTFERCGTTCASKIKFMCQRITEEQEVFLNRVATANILIFEARLVDETDLLAISWSKECRECSLW